MQSQYQLLVSSKLELPTTPDGFWKYFSVTKWYNNKIKRHLIKRSRISNILSITICCIFMSPSSFEIYIHRIRRHLYPSFFITGSLISADLKSNRTPRYLWTCTFLYQRCEDSYIVKLVFYEFKCRSVHTHTHTHSYCTLRVFMYTLYARFKQYWTLAAA